MMSCPLRVPDPALCCQGHHLLQLLQKVDIANPSAADAAPRSASLGVLVKQDEHLT